MDQSPSQAFVATLADARKLRLAAGDRLSWNLTEPCSKIARNQSFRRDPRWRREGVQRSRPTRGSSSISAVVAATSACQVRRHGLDPRPGAPGIRAFDGIG